MKVEGLSRILAILIFFLFLMGPSPMLLGQTVGTPLAWGFNEYGQLGNGTDHNDSDVPIQVLNITGVTSVAGGYLHSIALKNDGTVWDWGSNASGNLGDGTNTDRDVPVKALNLTGVTAIAAGGWNSMALRNDGTVWVWGDNLGNGTYNYSNIPVQVPSLSGVTAIAAGYDHSLALKNDGTVWAWGYNADGELGNGTNINSNIPVKIFNLTGITAISVAGGGFHSLALKNDETVWAWGSNTFGQLGNGTSIDSNMPAQVLNLAGAVAIAAGGGQSMALKYDGTVWSWGAILGNGTWDSSNVPAKVLNLIGVTAIAGGGLHSLALKNDGTVWTWGYNADGQLGNGTWDDSDIPGQVLYLSDITAIAGGDSHSLAVNSGSAPSCAINPNPGIGATGISTTPTLTWSSVSNANSYDIYFGTSSGPPYKTNTTGTSYNPGTLSQNTTYYWKIVPKNTSGNASGCPVWSFATKDGSVPPCASNPDPASGTTGVSTTPTLSWSVVSNATSYDVYFGTGSSPSYSTNTTGTSYQPGSLIGSNTFYWKIAPRNSNGCDNGCPVWNFATEGGSVPSCVSNPNPASGTTAVSTTPTLSWSAVSNATSYDIYFGISSSPSYCTNTTGTSYNPGSLSQNTTYYWKVVPKDSSGSATGCPVWSFTCPGGTVPSCAYNPNPAGGATGVTTTPMLTWSSVAGATSYDVYFGTSPSPPDVANVAGTNYTPGTLSLDTIYYWRIVPKNSLGSANGCPVLIFTTTDGSFPSCASNPNPSDGATGVSTTPTLSWSAVSNASSYDLYGGTTSSSLSLITSITAPSCNIGSLNGFTTYYWQVEPKNSSGRVSGCAVWSFTTSGESSVCSTDATTLCLNNNRFKVTVTWKDYQGNTGSGTAVPYGTTDSGLFWFFASTNWEMLIKVLNGCGVNGYYWVYAAATTDVEYHIYVTDTSTGATKEYDNTLGNPSPAITDSSAFAACGSDELADTAESWNKVMNEMEQFAQLRKGLNRSSNPNGAYTDNPETGSIELESGAASSCQSDPDTLCLNSNRFKVNVTWKDYNNTIGTGTVVPYGTSDSGLFWFFASTNWEMLIKVLNGCGVNGHYWVYAAATTDVEYHIKVTDTSTGVTKQYNNTLGNPSPAITDSSSFASCP